MALPHESAGQNERDKRVSASLTLLGVLICAMAYLLVTPQAATRSAAPAPSNRLAEAPPRVVKIVDGAAPSQSCVQRTWPYYDSGCPARANESAPPAAAPAPQAAAASPSAAVSPSAMSAVPSAALAATAPAAEPAAFTTAGRIVGGGATPRAAASATVGAAPSANPSANPSTNPSANPSANDAAPSSPPVARAGSDPDRVDRQRGDDRLAESDDQDARNFEPVKKPHRRDGRRFHFGGFGFRF